MKTIYLIRHSKSSWQNPKWTDQQRPLDKRGKRDAPLMACIMLLKEKKPELLISSHAKRAWTTAKMFQRIFMANKKELIKDPRIYHSNQEDIVEIIREIPPEFKVVYLFGHNPVMTTLVNSLGANIDNVPTTGIVRVDANIEDWQRWNLATAKIVAFYYPKMFV